MTHFTTLCTLAFCATLTNTSHAAWYQDRDNSMVDANDDVAESMVFVDSKTGMSIGTKVYCPKSATAVVLTSAHGVIHKSKQKAVSDTVRKMYSFPVSRKIGAKVSTTYPVVSPMLDTEKDWNELTNDYAFVTLAENLKPNVKGVRLMRTTAQDLQTASAFYDLDVHLYRGKTLHALNPDGSPDLSSVPGTRSPLKVLDIPQKTVKPCTVNTLGTRTNMTTTSCPLESGVSGSPFIITKKSVNYIVGIAKSAALTQRSYYNEKRSGSNFINSDSFCADYQKVCGVSCTDIKRVLSKREIKP